MKQRILEMIFMIAITYTILSMVNTVVVLIEPSYTYSPQNAIMMLLFSTVGVIVLFSHHLFKGVSPLAMLGLQYLIAFVLIVSMISLTVFFGPLHETAYRDGILSFTIPYIIGAIIYYLHLYLETKKYNRWIENIQKTKEL
jgi:hypothetical protein